MNIKTANRLCELRKAHNLSQEELAYKLGVSRQAVSKWERSESSPDTDNLIQLAALYNISLDELLNGNGDLYIYDGTGLQVVGGILEYYFTHGNSEKETWERYLGTLGSFVRIDKHTISFEDYHSDWSGFAVASYSLNENHDLCRIEKLSEVRKEKTE